MRFKKFLNTSYFRHIQESKMCPKPKMGIFTEGITFNDLMNAQQGIIHNYNYVQRKLVNSFE
jgi:hypothetical protein